MRRRVGAVVVTALSLAVPLSLTTPATAQTADADVPRTGFELNGGTAWTTLEEEQAFLAELDAASDRVSVTTLAQTSQGRPIQLVQIGTEQRSPAQIAARPSGLIQCLQHGNEPATREGCLQFMRDVAFDDSPETLRALQRSTLLVIPTVNPDGRARNTRGNAGGVDINRDHLALETVEAQTLAQVLLDYDPDLINDSHEYGPAQTGYNYDLLYLWPRNLNVDRKVYDLAVELNVDYTVPYVEAAGYTTSVYGIRTTNPPVQVAGDEDERIFRNMAGLRHVAGMLTETLTSQKAGENATTNRLRRVDTQLEAMAGTFAHLVERGPVLRAQTLAAERRAIALGRSGQGEIYFRGADNNEPAPDQVLTDPPCSYTLTTAQYDQVSRTLELHGIEVRSTSDGVSVTMGQAARNVIPLLVDDRARFNLVSATPVAC